MNKDDIQKTILVVDDDEAFLETLCKGLESHYKVIPAANAKEAMAIIDRTHIDLLVTDIKMPGLSGYELIKWVNSKHFQRKMQFIAMSGYLSLDEDELENEALQELQVLFTVSKPFKLAQLKQAIAIRLSDAAQNEEEISESHFCQVPISDIILRPILDFDIYLKLSELNFVKVAHKNEELPLEQLRKFRQRGLSYLFIRKEDFHRFVQFKLDFAAPLSKTSQFSQAQKIALLNYANQVMMEKIFREGLDEDSFRAVAAFVDLSLSTVLESSEVQSLLEVLKNVGEKVLTDSFAVALYSVLLAREMNYESALTAFKLCIAGLFQDIGIKEIDKEIIEKNIADLTKKEMVIFETHVVRSQQILESLKFVHSDIIRIVQEHHEDIEGRGYPFGKRRAEQHPLSSILQCSNVFIEKINSFKINSGRVDVAIVISDLEKNYHAKLDKNCIKALRSMFKLPAMGAEA